MLKSQKGKKGFQKISGNQFPIIKRVTAAESALIDDLRTKHTLSNKD